MVSARESQFHQHADAFSRDSVQQRPQMVYTKRTRERQVFMEDLKEYRVRLEKRALNKMKKLVGPTWYQVLSVPQREALDKLGTAISQDLLEDRPTKTSRIMHRLGIHPPLTPSDLMSANLQGNDDPKKMLAHIFLLLSGHSIEGKRNVYNFNSKLLLSAIYYLGLKNLIGLLREKFKPDQEPATSPKPKAKRQPSLASPYLKKTTIPVWVPAAPKKFKPAPLPQLDELDEPYVETDEYRIKIKQPPPPPPPPPPKRVPLALCDQLAGVLSIAPNTVTTVAMKTTTTQRKLNSKLTVEVKKKTYGICITRPDRKGSHRRPKAPSTGINNAQYFIQGVYKIGGRTVFVLGSVSITPPEGELIHGGFAQCPGGYMNIHLGFRGHPVAPPPGPCDCLMKWQDKVLNWAQQQNCHCGHHYDYGNEGTFSTSELPYFQKPTAVTPHQFNYHTIFDLDENQMFIKKEFKKIWEADNVIGSKKDDVPKKKQSKKITEADKKIESKPDQDVKKKVWNKVTEVDNKIESKQEQDVKKRVSKRVTEVDNKIETKQDQDVKKKEWKKTPGTDNKIESKQNQDVTKKEKKKSSKSCLGQNPKPAQYLKCALRLLRGVNLAARLPDVHLAPELLEWMRRRISGPMGPEQRQAYLRQTGELQTVLDALTPRICRSLLTKNNTDFRGASTWARKSSFRNKFNKFSSDYQRQVFKLFAYINNMFWRAMFHSEFPDKKFREIFFSYLYATVDDLMLMRPYSKLETQHRTEQLMNRRMICLPDGYEPEQ